MKCLVGGRCCVLGVLIAAAYWMLLMVDGAALIHPTKAKKCVAPLRGAQGTANRRISVQRTGDPLIDGGRTQHPKAEIAVTGAWKVVDTRRRTHRKIAPGAAAQHTKLATC